MVGKDLIMATLFGGGSGGGWPEAPDDGKTRLYIHLAEGRTSPMLGVGVNGTVTVDWGDGTEPDVLTGTKTSSAVWTPTHNYSAPGHYVITFSLDGEMALHGTMSANLGSYCLRYTASQDVRNYTYNNAIEKVDIGANTSTYGNYTFYSCAGLFEANLSNYQYNEIVGSMFYRCNRLARIKIPSNVTTISSSAFYQCYGVTTYDFTDHTAVPTLSNTNAFGGIPADCEIRVPTALYDEWIAATNWSTYADYIKAY